MILHKCRDKAASDDSNELESSDAIVCFGDLNFPVFHHLALLFECLWTKCPLAKFLQHFEELFFLLCRVPIDVVVY